MGNIPILLTSTGVWLLDCSLGKDHKKNAAALTFFGKTEEKFL
jgi:hypothetical protein